MKEQSSLLSPLGNSCRLTNVFSHGCETKVRMQTQKTEQFNIVALKLVLILVFVKWCQSDITQSSWINQSWLKAKSVSSAVFEQSMRMCLVAVDANTVTL